MDSIIDEEGYRENVGIVLANQSNELLWARRFGQDAWQFPQGGIVPGETPEQALYRELYEEVGLSESDVEVLGTSRNWMRYRLPERYQRTPTHKRHCVGQKQKWFLLRLIADDARVRFDHMDDPEFDQWRWVNFWYPVDQVVPFKQEVYRLVLKQFADMLQLTPEVG